MTDKKIKALISEDPERIAKLLLESHFWLPSLQTMVGYERRGDDTQKGRITVIIGEDGDGHINVISDVDPEEFTRTHRYRTHLGGGRSHLTHNALLIMALAIAEDNKRSPQPPPAS